MTVWQYFFEVIGPAAVLNQPADRFITFALHKELKSFTLSEVHSASICSIFHVEEDFWYVFADHCWYLIERTDCKCSTHN